MTVVAELQTDAGRDENQALRHLLLMRELEDFLYAEAALLDERRFSDWLNLLADDIRYWMPLRRNMSYRDRDRDITEREEVGWMDDDKATLEKRVRQIETGVHWAEEPLSRISRFISNIHLAEPVHEAAEEALLTVKSTILVHRSRNEVDRDILTARRIDKLRRTSEGLMIAQRTIIIDEAVLLTKSLTFFL